MDVVADLPLDAQHDLDHPQRTHLHHRTHQLPRLSIGRSKRPEPRRTQTHHIPQDKLADAASRIPDSTFITIPVGHAVYAAQPAEFATAVLDFVRR